MRALSYTCCRVRLAVHPETGHYWTTTNGKIAAGIKMLLSAAGADVDDGGVHGELRI